MRNLARSFPVSASSTLLATHAAASRLPPDSSVLLMESLHLTRCEANVLHWVREGKTSPEISIILGIALPTVKKHLEHVYEKLGVETRTAAALLASEVLHRHGAW